MVEQRAGPTSGTGLRRPGGATRGFLFSDLRGYTGFIDRHGAAAGAELLDRYRVLVREAIGKHDGAEIRTEGDGFYVVFGSVSEALECGLDIVASAAAASLPPHQPVHVGVGVHAGETVETGDSFVGQPVNIAARLCAMAAAGEVLVSDTVRSLTESVLPARFVARGRRRLKGISEPVHVYAVTRGDRGSASRRRPVGGRGLIALVTIGATLMVAVGWLALQPRVVAPAEWKIGLSLPLSGEQAAYTEPLRAAVELALTDAAPGLPLGARIRLDGRDDAVDGVENRARAAENAAAFVADLQTIAMIGPFSSFVAEGQIPLTNEAGLLQCSATNTDPRLTKPPAALGLRSSHPDRINYVRLPAAADIETAAAASFAYRDLAVRRALVVDDTQEVGRLVADAFQQEFEAIGGTVVRRALNPGLDPNAVLQPLSAAHDPPTLVYFGGFSNTGGPELRRAMVDGGYGTVAFLSFDGLWDGSGRVAGSFINRAGSAAVGSIVTRASIGTVHADFERRYRAEYGDWPTALIREFSAGSYACAQIIVQSLTAVLPSTATPAAVREAVRAHAVSPQRRFETVVGNVGFDRNGDSIRQFVTFYRVDAQGAGGAGDWVIAAQQDFAPAP